MVQSNKCFDDEADDEDDVRYDEHDDQVTVAESMLGEGIPPEVCTERLEAQFGLTIEESKTVLAAAVARLLGQVAESREYMRALTLNFLQSILQNPDAETSDQIAAQSQICELLGLNAPQRMEIRFVGKHKPTAPDVQAAIMRIFESRRGG
ncbi:hypothetical protein ACFL2H_00435 [Planctomycetota bacterium]